MLFGVAMGSMWQDVRFGVRLVGRSPGLAAVTVLTLALGIGANTAIFTLLDAVLLRPLPVPHPERLVQIAPIYRNGANVPMSYALFQQVQNGQRAFSSLIGWTNESDSNVEVKGVLSLSSVRGVSGNYYDSLGATPSLGRLIQPGDVASASPVAVLGYEFWQRRFGGDPRVVGTAIRIDGHTFTIVGVSRKWFMGMTPGSPPDVTIPFNTGRLAKYVSMHSLLYIFATARLADGVGIEQAREQVRSFWHDALVATAPTATPGPRLQSWLHMDVDVTSASTGISRDLRARFARPLRVLMGLVVLILLVACVNLASLTLARTVARRREMSVRVALGASRADVLRQIVTEQLVLSTAGTLQALAFANWASNLLLGMMNGGGSLFVLDLWPDWRVFAFAAAAAVATATVIALSPAWQTSKQPPAAVLRMDDRTSARATGIFGRALIVAQIALSLVLLFGSGLLLRTFESLRAADPQFQRNGVLQVTLQPRPEQPSDSGSDEYLHQLQDTVANLPGVTSAGFASLQVPAGDSVWRDTVALSDAAGEAGHIAYLVGVTPGWLQTLGIPTVAGRPFRWDDDAKHPRVAVVDENLAKRLQGSGNVIGRLLRFGVQPDYQHLQVVGVAHNAHVIDLRDPDAPVIYVPVLQLGQPRMNLFVRTPAPAATAKAVETVVKSFGREYVESSRTLDESSARALTEDRVTAMLSSSFGAMALLLAGIGVFGLMSYTVTRRTREIGIRMALGSQRGGIVRLVMRQSLQLTILGIVAGAPCAFLGSRLIVHLLFGVTPSDPLTFAVSAAALLLVGAAAAYWPAHRAMNTDPAIALRAE